MSPIQLKISSKSSIKKLRLIGINEHCSTDRLSVLLQHLPCLQSLHIIANQLNFVSKTNTEIISTAPISNFILNIHQFNVRFVEFSNFISTLTPCVQELTIICRASLENLTYLNHQEWIPFIQSLPNLKKLTLNISRTRTINEQTWEKNCQELTKLMTKNHIAIQIHE
jgi:hypothetical protein